MTANSTVGPVGPPAPKRQRARASDADGDEYGESQPCDPADDPSTGVLPGRRDARDRRQAGHGGTR